MTESIDHVAAAVGYLHPDSYQPEKAQVHATLALAEQQRIANLLVALTTYERWPSRALGKSFNDVQANVSELVREALGLS